MRCFTAARDCGRGRAEDGLFCAGNRHGQQTQDNGNNGITASGSSKQQQRKRQSEEREREKGGALLPADAPRVKGLVTDSSSRRKKEREKNNGEKSRGGRCQPSDSLCFLLRFHSSFFRPALVRSMHDTFCSPYLFFHALLPYTASPLGSEGLGYAWFRKVRFFHPSSVW